MIGQPNYMNFSAPQPPLPRMQQIQPQGGINWVQGEAGANAAFVPFGQSGVFFDSNSDRFWIKSVDPSGRPFPLQPYRYEPIVEAGPAAAQPALTREDVQAMIDDALAALAAQKKKEAKNE